MIKENTRHDAWADFHGESLTYLLKSASLTLLYFCFLGTCETMQQVLELLGAVKCEGSSSRGRTAGLYRAIVLLSGALTRRWEWQNALPMCDLTYYERDHFLSTRLCVSVYVSISGVRWVCGDKGIPPTAAKYHFSAHWEELPTWTTETSSRVWVTGSGFKGLFWAGCIIYKAFPRTAFLTVSMTRVGPESRFSQSHCQCVLFGGFFVCLFFLKVCASLHRQRWTFLVLW